MQRMVVMVLPVLLVLASHAPPARCAERYEAARDLKASKLLEPKVLRGAQHSVLESVTTTGFFHRFDVRTPYGLWPAGSRAMLALRLHELAALQRAGRASVPGEFLKAAEKSLRQLPTSAVKILKNPLGAATAAGSGAFRTFGNLTRGLKTRKKIRGEQSRIEGALYGKEMREVAVALGLDPYSTNPKVRAFLTDLARARALGRFAAGQVTQVIPSTAGSFAVSAVQFHADVTKRLVEKSPAELDEQHRGALSRMGIHRYVIQRFLGNANLSPTHRVTIVSAVKRLHGVKGLGVLLEAAAEARDEVHALMNVTRVLMVLSYHGKDDRFESLHVVGAIVAGRTTGGTLVVPAPIDILYWNREAEAGAQALQAMRDRTKAVGLTLRVTGRMTRRAIEAFRRRGFRVEWGVPTPRELARRRR